MCFDRLGCFDVNPQALGLSPALSLLCSCSLHLSVNSITLGQCAAAVNAGVNLLITPNTTAMTQKAGMLALDGRCKTLSPAADGYARADTCGVMLLVPRQAAAAATGQSGSPGSNSSLLTLVAGTAVNQDGRSSTLTAPNGPSQQDVVRAALAASQLAPADVAALQMHGTGTSLGDPIEVGALAAALVDGQRTPAAAAAEPLVLMAAKSWTGHAEPGAGAVGLVHAQAALSQAASLPIMHLGALNPYVSGAMEMGGQLHSWSVPRQPAALARGSQGRQSAIGVSAFAFQGTNAHALLRAASLEGATMVKVAAGWARQRFWVAPGPHAGGSPGAVPCICCPNLESHD